MTLPAAALRRPRAETAIILVLSGALTLGLVLLALVTLRIARADALREADLETRNLAYAAGQEVARDIALHDRQLRAIVQELHRPGALALPAVQRQSTLFDGAAGDEPFDFINVLDKGGDVIADSGAATRRNGNWRNRDYFRAQRKGDENGLFIGKPFDSVRDVLAVIPLSRRISTPGGDFAGAVVGMMRLSFIADLLRRFQFGADGTIILLRQDGMMLQRWPTVPKETGSILGDTRLRIAASSPIVMEDPFDHIRRRYVVTQVPDLPLLVAAGAAYPDIFAAWWDKAAVLVPAVLAIGLANAGLLLLLFIRLRRRAAVHAHRARYLAMLGHEVRDPMQNILFRAETMQQSLGQPGALTANLGMISDECSQLHDILDRLFDYARVESRSDTLKLKHEALPALVEKCMASVAHIAQRKELQTVLRIDRDVPHWMETDGARLRIILRNLLNNAIRYTKQGSVSLRVAHEGPSLRFTVADTGIGIPEPLRDRLARPFDRLDLDRDGDSEGAGLGLSIVCLFASQLGGRLEYRPNTPMGSVFSVQLPLANAGPEQSTTPREPGGVGPARSESARQPCAAANDFAQRPQEPSSGASRSECTA